MIKKSLVCFCLMLAFSALAQTPQAFKYQCVVRDNVGVVLPNQLVRFKISLLENSTTGLAVYEEEHLVIMVPFL